MKRKVDADDKAWRWFTKRQKLLVAECDAGMLHDHVDQANAEYGHGIARTGDFGFAPGDNMCRDLPMEVKAHLAACRVRLRPVY